MENSGTCISYFSFHQHPLRSLKNPATRRLLDAYGLRAIGESYLGVFETTKRIMLCKAHSRRTRETDLFCTSHGTLVYANRTRDCQIVVVYFQVIYPVRRCGSSKGAVSGAHGWVPMPMLRTCQQQGRIARTPHVLPKFLSLIHI